MLSQRADEAAAFARAAVTNAQDFTNAHASILAKHRKMFLERAFGIDPDGLREVHRHDPCDFQLG
jgi:hypothetical protein